MRRTAASAPSATATTTVTIENTEPSSSSQNTNLVLKLNRKKKSVTWKEGTVDNEFMQKKSSKKCCIFHKQKSFDEDYSSDEDSGDHPHRPDGDYHRHDSCGSCSNDSTAHSAGASKSID